MAYKCSGLQKYKELRYKGLWCMAWEAVFTNYNECEVEGEAAKSIGDAADVLSGILQFHFFDLQTLFQNLVAAPAWVHVPPILHPQDQRRGVTLHRAWKTNRVAQFCSLSVLYFTTHPWWTWCKKKIYILSNRTAFVKFT